MGTSSKKVRPVKSKPATPNVRSKAVRGRRDSVNLPLKKLGEEFVKRRTTDETKFTPLQRRMTSGGA